ncbi:MAG: hypothetical protein ACOYT8_00840 [Candidatus Dependentiae bacterium]
MKSLKFLTILSVIALGNGLFAGEKQISWPFKPIGFQTEHGNPNPALYKALFGNAQRSIDSLQNANDTNSLQDFITDFNYFSQSYRNYIDKYALPRSLNLQSAMREYLELVKPIYNTIKNLCPAYTCKPEALTELKAWFNANSDKINAIKIKLEENRTELSDF